MKLIFNQFYEISPILKFWQNFRRFFSNQFHIFLTFHKLISSNLWKFTEASQNYKECFKNSHFNLFFEKFANQHHPLPIKKKPIKMQNWILVKSSRAKLAKITKIAAWRKLISMKSFIKIVWGLRESQKTVCKNVCMKTFAKETQDCGWKSSKKLMC